MRHKGVVHRKTEGMHTTTHLADNVQHVVASAGSYHVTGQPFYVVCIMGWDANDQNYVAWCADDEHDALLKETKWNEGTQHRVCGVVRRGAAS
jgi:hypothetical protein